VIADHGKQIQIQQRMEQQIHKIKEFFFQKNLIVPEGTY
jgi:hypothetical protein